MSRTERLLDLIEILRSRHYPISGRDLAQQLRISLRTLYRDIATLQSQGAEIEGEAGVGYILKRSYTLPPMMFSIDEIEAMVLGSHFVANRSDNQLSKAATTALAKITSVLPEHLRQICEQTTLINAPFSPPTEIPWLPELRQAIRNEKKVTITYCDRHEQTTTRTLWPFGIAFFDQVYVALAYCELRNAFRHFRVDRITLLEIGTQRYPRSRRLLIKEWRELLDAEINNGRS